MNRSLALCFRLLLSVPIAALVPACTADQSSTAQPPSFGGALTATAGPGAGEITLTWSPAISVGGGAITYFVFDTLVGSGLEDVGNPVASTTSPTGMVVTGLTSHDEYWFIVRAQDSTGAMDANVVEVTNTPP